MDDREQKIKNNIGLVHACAKRFKGKNIEYDDLFQAGCLGLVKAVDAFDQQRGVKFSTYAVPVILGEMRRLFRDGGAVKVGRSLKELSLKATKECAAFAAREGRQPTIGELAAALGVERAQAAQALCARQTPVSLTSEDDTGGQLDIPVAAPEEALSDRLALWQVIGELGAQDQALITLRYIKGQTQTQTAAHLGMTQVQVSRREKKILTQLRARLNE